MFTAKKIKPDANKGSPATAISYAIGQSAQPILSYNFGAGDTMRVRSAFRLALGTAVTCGLVFFALTALFNHQIVAMFIDRSYPAYDIAVAGLPLFASGFIFFAVNIVSIGYFQSVERARPAMMVTVLRGLSRLSYGIIYHKYNGKEITGNTESSHSIFALIMDEHIIACKHHTGYGCLAQKGGNS